ncbi:Tetratricopeptide repeat-containing protein [Actinoplanes cyaneus]|nr:Tetratricopeptide repeat-containing protein [Actinoplanes cyaneus]
MCTGKALPTPHSLSRFLDKYGVDKKEKEAWIAARERAASPRPSRFPAARRVRETDPGTLGVHPAIDSSECGGDLPQYIPRDLDADLRRRIRDGAGDTGCFVMLVGSSSVGKTRCAYEAVSAELPDWWLLHPTNSNELASFAEDPIGRTVIWLDELQRYFLDGLQPATVRKLIHARDPVVVIATLWPSVYERFASPPSDEVETVRGYQQIVEMGKKIWVAEHFSAAERQRAVDAGDVDDRIATSLHSEFGVTQALAAAPALVSRWQSGTDVYGRAVITAAVDARRLGIRSLLSGELLKAAAPGYLTLTQRATAPADWFETAVEYATRLLHGAARALVPVGSVMSRIDGYEVADFLVQTGARSRRMHMPPIEAWAAYAAADMSADERTEVGKQAHRRMLLPEAETLFRGAMAQGSEYASLMLAQLLHQQGRIADLERLPADPGIAGDFVTRAIASLRGEPDPTIGSPSWRLAQSASEGDEGSEVLLRHNAKQGDPEAALDLGLLLQHRGRHEEAQKFLRRALAAGSPAALAFLIRGLLHLGRTAEAEEQLRKHLTDLPSEARPMLANLLEQQNRHEEAEQWLRAAVDAEDDGARQALASRLRVWGHDAAAEATLRDAIAAGESDSRHALALFLIAAERADEAEAVLRQGAALGDVMSRDLLTQRLRDSGRREETQEVLREAVHHDDPMALRTLVEMFVADHRARECETFLRESITAGVLDADVELIRFLVEQGRPQEAATLQRYGLRPDGKPARF